jgi:hypothetical protein
MEKSQSALAGQINAVSVTTMAGIIRHVSTGSCQRQWRREQSLRSEAAFIRTRLRLRYVLLRTYFEQGIDTCIVVLCVSWFNNVYEKNFRY